MLLEIPNSWYVVINKPRKAGCFQDEAVWKKKSHKCENMKLSNSDIYYSFKLLLRNSLLPYVRRCWGRSNNTCYECTFTTSGFSQYRVPSGQPLITSRLIVLVWHNESCKVKVKVKISFSMHVCVKNQILCRLSK